MGRFSVADLPIDSLGGRIRAKRIEAGLTLTELADRAKISKSYLWNLENKEEHQKPSADTLYALAETLDTTMSELLGKRLLNEPVADVEINPTLAAFARKRGLAATEVRQLASIQWRGDPPKTEERWGFIHNALKASRSLDS